MPWIYIKTKSRLFVWSLLDVVGSSDSWLNSAAQLQVTWCGSPRSAGSLPVPFKEVQSFSWGQKRARKYFCSTKDRKSLFSAPQSLTFSFTEEFNFPQYSPALETQHSTSTFCCVFMLIPNRFIAQICTLYTVEQHFKRESSVA